MGIELAADDDVVIVRELTSAGRSQARINGVAVSASQLRIVGAHVVDAVGQGEAHRLLEPAFARDVARPLRRPGRARAARASARRATTSGGGCATERDALRDGGERALAEREFARFALAEIEAAKLEDGRRRSAARAARRARQRGEDRGARWRTRARRSKTNAARSMRSAMPRTRSAASRSSARRLRRSRKARRRCKPMPTRSRPKIARAHDDVELDPNELEIVTARLDAIETLKKKYGASIAAVLAARERFAAHARKRCRPRRTARGDRTRARGARYARSPPMRRRCTPRARRRFRRARRAWPKSCTRSRCRRRASRSRSNRSTTIAAHGGDRIEFRFSANPGEPERPLARIASGGERSRVLLALVVVLADERDARAFVFDEIDAGIGGATAVAVGARLQRLAQTAQVVCVTHLAQIASWAGTHYALRKYDDGGETTIEVVPLRAEADRLAEIARMLSGDTKQISLEHAATLVASTRGAARARSVTAGMVAALRRAQGDTGDENLMRGA